MSEGSAASAADKRRLEALSEFRYRLRNFLRFSEDAAREEGITVLHYQLLLHTQGFAGRDWATVTEIAERLQAQVHGVVALISRCEEAGLVQRKSLLGQGQQILMAVLYVARAQLSLRSVRECGQRACVD